MRDPIEVRVSRLESTATPSAPVPGILRVDILGLTFRPDDPSDPGLTIGVERIAGVNLSVLPGAASTKKTSIAVDTLEQRFRFLLDTTAERKSAEVLFAAREAITEQFGVDDEVTIGSPPSRKPTARGPHVVLGVSDISSDHDGRVRTLLVQVSATSVAYAWKRIVVLPRDVYLHLLAGFDALVRPAQGEASAGMREIGSLLLHNTVTARAMTELNRLSPSLVTLQIDDLLAHLPWGILHDGASYPLLATAVSQQIATLDPAILPPRRSDRRRALILANPTGDLPATEAEARGLRDWFGKTAKSWQVDVWIGAEASRVKVLQALGSGQYEIVHYAGHSMFVADAPAKSAWKLHDGRLTAAEIQQNVETNPPGLVYSSSCEGAREGDRDTLSYHRRLFGLTSAFLTGGVRNYLGFFWPIPDDGATELAIAFYGALLVEGKSVAESLRIAKQKLSTEPGDPRLWGGAMLFGDPSTLHGSRARD